MPCQTNQTLSDAVESSLKASKQQLGTQGEMQEQVVSILKKSDPAASSEDINKSAGSIAKAIMKDGEGLSSSLKSVIGSSKLKIDDNMKVSDMATMATSGAGALAGTLMGGKTVRDIQSVEQANTLENPDGFIDAKRRESASAGTQDAKQNLLVDTQSSTQSIIDKERAKQADLEETTGIKGLVEKYDQDAARIGLIETNEDGSVKIDPKTNKPIATTGDKFTMARAAASANNALMENAVNVGGSVFRESFNAQGEGTVSASLGDNSNYNAVNKAAEGNDATVNLLKPNDLKNARISETAAAVLNPSKSAPPLLAEIFSNVEDTVDSVLGVDENSSAVAKGTSSVIAGTVATVTTGAAVETVNRGVNLALGKTEPVLDKNGKPVLDETKPITNPSGDKQFKDANGNKVFQSTESGEFYTQSTSGETKPHSGEKLTQSFEPKTRVARGVVSKTLEGAKKAIQPATDKIGESVGGFFGDSSSETINEATKSTPNPTNDSGKEDAKNYEHNDGTQNDTSKTKSKKGTSPLSDNIVPKNQHASKSLNPNQPSVKEKIATLSDLIASTESTPNETAGRGALAELVDEKLETVEKGSSAQSALRKTKAALKGDGKISQGLLRAGGIDAKELDKNNIYTSSQNGKSFVDFDTTGEYAKVDKEEKPKEMLDMIIG